MQMEIAALFLAFYLVPVQVTKLYLHFFTAYFRARRILPFHLLPPPFPPLGTSLPGGKLRPLEGSAPFLGGAADDHVRASHGGNTHGRRDTGRRPRSVFFALFSLPGLPFSFPFSFFLPPAS